MLALHMFNIVIIHGVWFSSHQVTMKEPSQSLREKRCT